MILNNLHLLNINSGFYINILHIFTVSSIICGILIITTRNPIISVLYLISLFWNISMYLFLIGLNFIAFSYLLVYIGAVSILFLFILMLINIRTSELTYNTTNSISLALYLGLIIYFILFIVLLEDVEFYIENIDYVTSTNWDSNIIEYSDISSIGNILYTNYSIWLIITSLILLLTMIGAIIITTKS